MDLVSRLKTLVGYADAALAIDSAVEADRFLDAISLYLAELESWQREVQLEKPLAPDSLLSDGEKVAFRADVERLIALHQKLLQHAGLAKEEVGQRMGELHKKATGLKKYVDTLPARITIAGKREG